MLEGKTIVLGVTGGIAAYKIPMLASRLVKAHADVHVVMTQNATHFVTPITFETLTGNKCLIDTFDRNFEFNVEHVSLAQKADLVLIAPATANVIGKMAHGIADDMLTTTILACQCKILVSPSMNTRMFENPIVQENIATLQKFGMEIITPLCGHLACGDTGMGKMPEPDTFFEYICRELQRPKDMTNWRVLVTAGPTQEAIDPVRFITNHSSGKMGYAMAKECMLRGAIVTLITGKTNLTPPPFVQVIHVTNAKEMYEKVLEQAPKNQLIIKAAAVSDFTPLQVASEKIKKTQDCLSLSLKRTDDILATLGDQKSSEQFLLGFAMETKDMEKNAKDKLQRKNLDMIVANNLKVDGAGFETPTNVVTMITATEKIPLPKMSKEEVAHAILEEVLCRFHPTCIS